MNRNVILVDIDHTLFASWKRDASIGVVHWDDYHRAALNDEPYHDVINMVNSLHRHGYLIVMITARPGKWRRLTMTQLLRATCAVDELLMRNDEDYRPSPHIKKELALARFPDIKNQVAFALEDRDDVVAMFKEIGITCLQVHGRRD